MKLWCGLLVCLLVRAGLAEVCDWELVAESGQASDAEVPQLDQKCQKACCAAPDCRLAVLNRRGDGEATCQLHDCLNPDDCVPQPREQLTVYRRRNTGEPRDDAVRCRLPMKVGPCKAAFHRFYYNPNSSSCEEFIYGGCEANKNNFATLDECEAACNGVTGSVLPDNTTSAAPRAVRMMPAQHLNPEMNKEAEAGPTTPDSEPAENATTETVPAEEKVSPTPRASLPEMSASEFAERCEAPFIVGLCRASFPRWYYDSKTSTCRSFTYGGCQGNKNNYETEESCMATCTVTVVPSNRRGPAETPGPAPSTPSPAPEDKLSKDYTEHCTVASDPGPCRAAFPMYFFEPGTGTCQSFIYGGCKGNNNRYGTMAECMARCAGSEGRFDGRGHGKARDRWTPAFFLVGTLSVISALLLTALVLITLRRNRLPRRSSSISDKEELLPDPDEQSSVDSLSVPESPKEEKA